MVVVAGGLGLAPLRPVVYELLANRERFGSVALLYGGRDAGASCSTAAELERWRGRARRPGRGDRGQRARPAGAARSAS